LKAKKHDEIRVLADSKLNTIADYVSTSLIDGEITAQEFKLVLDEMSKYQQMKKEIRDGAQKAHAAVELDEETKKTPSSSRATINRVPHSLKNSPQILL